MLVRIAVDKWDPESFLKTKHLAVSLCVQREGELCVNAT